MYRRFKMQCQLRLKKELERFQSQPTCGISCWQTDNLFQLKASIIGPDNSPYKDGIFYIDIQIPDRYPFSPPNVRFITPVYHPNIDDSGRICLDALKLPPQGSWKPSLNLCSILMAVRLLMSEPNFNDPLMSEIAQEYQMNRASYITHATEWTTKHAKSQNVQSGTLTQSADPNCVPSTKRSAESVTSADSKKQKMF